VFNLCFFIINLQNCVLIDVRRDEEFNNELSHINGAQLVTLEKNLTEFLTQNQKSLSDKNVVFICRSGARSLHAAQIAQSLNYKNIINLKGGMMAWNNAGLQTAK
jgi:hydroxyacylglutathione hydrolase